MVADKMSRSKWYGFRVRVRMSGRVGVRVSKIEPSYHSDPIPFCPRIILS
jgi:hypothetical protein